MPDLFPTLLQIFLTIKLGWLAGFFKIISPTEAKGLNIFVGKFSLPVLIFVSLATLDFSNINWSFLLAIAISKTLIFVFVGFSEFLVHNPKDVSRAAIFAIFCTQTNDFGMGLPILDAVYGGDHPFVGLLYLVAPISLLVLNPAGFILMEAEKNLSKGKQSLAEKFKTLWIVMRSLCLNPIVNMTFFGVIANVVFKGCLPDSILKFLSSLGAAFTSLAPFTLGLSMVGKLGNVRGENLKPIIALVIIKSIFTPIITIILVDYISSQMSGSVDPGLSNFAFLYGTFPTALGVDSYAGQYNVSPDLISAAIIIGTAFSAPLMYVSANILTVLSTTKEEFKESFISYDKNICIFTMVGALLVGLIFIISKRFMKIPHCLTMSILFSSIQLAVGSLLYKYGHDGCHWSHQVQIIVRLHGLYSCFLSTSVLAATLLLLSHGLSATIKKIKLLLISSGPILAALAVTLSFLLQPISDADYNDVQHVAGNIHNFVTIAVTSFSLIVTTTCLGLKHRIEIGYPNLKDEDAPLKSCQVLTG